MFLLPKTIGALTLQRKLGSGGVAETYLGSLEGAQKPVVVRRVLPFILRDSSRLAGVQSRVQDLAGIKHPFVVQVLDFVQAEDEVLVVEEFVDGITLDRVLSWCRQNGRTVPPNVFLNVATQVCNGLEALHAREGKITQSENVLHLALRPGAIYINRQGKVILGSYGLTRSPTTLPSGGASGPVPLRMEYLSPEQTHPDQKLGPPSDIFSLASVLYELLTLEPLFRAESNLQTINRIRRAEVAGPLAAVRERMPGLEKVLFRALSLNPRHRYQRAFVLREDIRGLMAGYSFASIGEETRTFVAPLFDALADVASDPVGTASALAAGASDFADNPSTDVDVDPVSTARLTSDSRVAHLASSQTALADSYAEGEHTETMEDADAPADPVTTVAPNPLRDPPEPPTLSNLAMPETTASVLAASLPAAPTGDHVSRSLLVPALAVGVAADSTAGYLASEGLAPRIAAAPRIMEESDDNTANYVAEARLERRPTLSPNEVPAPRVLNFDSLQPLAASPSVDPTSSTGDARLDESLAAQMPPASAFTNTVALAPPERGDAESVSAVAAVAAGAAVAASAAVAANAAPKAAAKSNAKAAAKAAAKATPKPDPMVALLAPEPTQPLANEPTQPLAPEPTQPLSRAVPPPATPTYDAPPSDGYEAPPPRSSPVPMLLAAGGAFAAVLLCGGVFFGAATFGPSAAELVAGAEAPKVEAVTDEAAPAEAAPAGAAAPAEEGNALAATTPPEPSPGASTPPPAEIAAPKSAPEPVTASRTIEPEPASPTRVARTEPAAAPVEARAGTSREAPREEPVPVRTTTSRSAAVATPTSTSTSTPRTSGTAGRSRSAAVEVPVEAAVTDEMAGEVAPALDLSTFTNDARNGRLGPESVATLQEISSGDANYSRARALLLMNAQKKGDASGTRRYLDELMTVPENRYNPVYLTDAARYAVNQGEYKKALDQASLAERNWGRLPSELVFSKKAEIYEIQAAAYQGRFYKNAEDTELLESSIRYWRKYREHVQTKGRSDLVKKADTELEKLEGIREKLK